MIGTKRLLLRRWIDSDRDPFAALNADPVVMEHFAAPLSREESDSFADRIETGFSERGWGLWAIEAPQGFVGFAGLSVPTFKADFLPAVEVGWRLARSAWGKGYASEAATASLKYGFEELGLEEVISFTSTTNSASERVMQRIGMMRTGEFDHPVLPEGHRLRRHVLYRARQSG